MSERQGIRLSKHDVDRIRSLLANTELTMKAIAARMGCSCNVVHLINKRFGVRCYMAGQGWIVTNDSQEVTAEPDKGVTW